MSYRSILTMGLRSSGFAPALQVASWLAQAGDGHLDVLALGLDVAMPGYVGYGGSMAILAVAMDDAREAVAVAEAELRVLLARESPTLRWSVEAEVAAEGALHDLVAHHARYSDLVVLPKPYGAGRGSADQAMVEAVLFGGHCPVLLLPEAFPADRAIGIRPVIAWNGSDAALAAVRRALPFLKSAKIVNVVVIDPSAQGPERSDPGGMLCRMLARHGVSAEVSVLARSAPRISDVLHSHLRDRDGDLLVMGAYGHSRLREAIFGGVTRDMLEQAAVPVFLAH